MKTLSFRLRETDKQIEDLEGEGEKKEEKD